MKVSLPLLLFGVIALVSYNSYAMEFLNKTGKTIVVKVYAEGDVCWKSPPLKTKSTMHVEDKPTKCVGKMYNVKSQFSKKRTRYKCSVKDMPWETKLTFLLTKSGKVKCTDGKEK